VRRSALGLITSLAVMAGCARKPAAPRSALPLAEAPAPTMTLTASSDPPRPPPPDHIANAEEAAKLMALFTPTAGDSGTAAEPVAWSRLEPEHIKRVTRGSFPKFRQCYEVALAQYPAMKPHGTVRSRYIIGPDGFIEIVHSVAGIHRSHPQ
jgi:hypothetical protein